MSTTSRLEMFTAANAVAEARNLPADRFSIMVTDEKARIFMYYVADFKVAFAGETVRGVREGTVTTYYAMVGDIEVKASEVGSEPRCTVSLTLPVAK